MKITRIMTASAVALTLALGAAISASAATFDMNTPAITGEGIVLENPGDSITTEGTSEELQFDSNFKYRWEDDYDAGEYAEDEYSQMYDGNTWGGVKEFSIDDNGIYRITEYSRKDYFYLEEGNIAVVTYVPGSGDDNSSSGYDYDDYWHIKQIADDRVDLSTADVQVNTTDKTITVVDADGNPVDSGCYTVEFVKGDSSSTEFPTEGGEYTVVVTAAPGSRYFKGVNDNATFTVEEDESSESTADSSEATSEDESAPEVIDSQDDSSVADSSKADASSKATSTASTTNPGTGAAAALGILAVTTAGVVVTKRKSK